jgi:hypothetical protein
VVSVSAKQGTKTLREIFGIFYQNTKFLQVISNTAHICLNNEKIYYYIYKSPDIDSKVRLSHALKCLHFFCFICSQQQIAYYPGWWGESPAPAMKYEFSPLLILGVFKLHVHLWTRERPNLIGMDGLRLICGSGG